MPAIRGPSGGQRRFCTDGSETMKLRQSLAVSLTVLGAFLMWFAPESAGGIALIIMGIGIEIAGIVLEHRR